MGLDLVEFTFAIEDAFGIYIPDADAATFLTPRQLVAYLAARLRPGTPPACLEQRAFYLLRRAGIQALERSPAVFVPDAPWADLLHPGHERREWELLGKAVGIAPWPALKGPLTWGLGAKTVGNTARELVATTPGALLTQTEGWDRASIEAVVRRHVAEELGVTDFSWTDEFVRDLGCG